MMWMRMATRGQRKPCTSQVGIAVAVKYNVEVGRSCSAGWLQGGLGSQLVGQSIFK